MSKNIANEDTFRDSSQPISSAAINLKKEMSYMQSFIKSTDLTVRSGKGVYIREDYHNNINRIISIIADSNISITDYLDNVLTYHFQEFENEITASFIDKYKPIIIKNK